MDVEERRRRGIAARRSGGTPTHRRVPHYRQTLGFTCGPSALMMAMRAFDPKVRLDRLTELALWKEATSIFSGSSHGGCGALGLALAARRRGFAAEVYVNHRGVLLSDRARLPERREVMRLLHEADLEEAAARAIPVAYRALKVDEIEAKFRQGWLPVVLVSTRYVHGDHDPHWIVVTGADDEAMYVNDPWVDPDKGKTAADMSDVRVPRADFDRMATYGKRREKAVVLVGRPRPAGA